LTEHLGPAQIDFQVDPDAEGAGSENAVGAAGECGRRRGGVGGGGAGGRGGAERWRRRYRLGDRVEGFTDPRART
jgi:hypothetical protein